MPTLAFCEIFALASIIVVVLRAIVWALGSEAVTLKKRSSEALAERPVAWPSHGRECPCNSRYGGDPYFYPHAGTKDTEHDYHALPARQAQQPFLSRLGPCGAHSFSFKP